MASPQNQIINVTSDHLDPSTLPTVAPGSTGSGQLNVGIYTIPGQPHLDPLQSQNTQIVTELTAMSIPAFRSGVRFIAETIAGLERHVHQRKGGTVTRLDQHPAEWTLNCQPNDLQTPAVFWTTYLTHAVVWSNAYAAIWRQPDQTTMFNLPPDRVYPFRFGGKQWFALDTETGKDKDRYMIFGSDEILHLPAIGYDGMQGDRMVRAMAGSLATIKQTERYVTQFYTQGGLMGGFLETENELSTEQVIDVNDQLRNKFSGVDNAVKWMTLPFKLKAKPHVPQLDTAQTSENRQYSVVEICRMLRVTPHLNYSLEKATWANVESLGIETVKYTLQNWLVPLDQEITRKFLTVAERKDGTYIRSDVSGLLRGDHAAQIAAAVSRTQNGLTTPDEERANWELPPYEDGIGSTPRVPANTVSLTLPAAPQAMPQLTLPAPQPTAPAASPAVEETEDLQAVKKPVEDFATKEHLKLAHFESFITDAAERVHKKTDKAIEAAQKKHAGNAVGWTAWSNVFTADQTHHAAAALAPVFQTYSNLSGKDTTGMADRCGQRYGRQLGQHLLAIGHGQQESTAPDLKQIVMQMEGASNDHQ